MNQSKNNSYKNLSKQIKSDNFCYRKVGRAITKWGAIGKSPILLSQYWKNYHFITVTKKKFDGSNNIFADCIHQSNLKIWNQNYKTIENQTLKRWTPIIIQIITHF